MKEEQREPQIKPAEKLNSNVCKETRKLNFNKINILNYINNLLKSQAAV